MAIQIAKHYGAEVATTCSTRNLEWVRSLGADTVIDYTREDFEQRLRDYDVVLESLGGSAAYRALKVLRHGGRLSEINAHLVRAVERYGPYLGVMAAGLGMARLGLVARALYGVRAKNILRPSDGAILGRIMSLVEEGAIRPLVDRVLPLETIADAHRLLEGGGVRGKIVIAVRSGETTASAGVRGAQGDA